MKDTKTHIIATIGPSSLDFPVFEALVREGADIVRINTAYATEAQYRTILGNIRKLPPRRNVEVLFDIRSGGSLGVILPYNPEIIAVSFSESKEQLADIQREVPKSRLIAKIESVKGVERFDEILSACWGVMVARGDLGTAVLPENVPCLQKRFTKKVIAKNAFLIVATEMLLSMTGSPDPTRAEVSDVANAVFEGAHAVMLSEETAVGRYPVESVRHMRKIVKAAESCA